MNAVDRVAAYLAGNEARRVGWMDAHLSVEAPRRGVAVVRKVPVVFPPARPDLRGMPVRAGLGGGVRS